MDIGKKILEYRKKAGLSQEELGYKLFVTRQSISLWENNQVQPSLENLMSLAKIFNVSVNEFLDEDVQIIETKEILFKAKTEYNKDVFKNINNIIKKIKVNTYFIFFAILFFMLSELIVIGFNSSIFLCNMLLLMFLVLDLINTNKNNTKITDYILKSKPNLKIEYLFYDDYFEIISTSDNSNEKLTIKYNEINSKYQDDKYIYLLIMNSFFAIDKSSCIDNIDELHKLLKINKIQKSKKVNVLLWVMFILALVSIQVGLMIVALCTSESPFYLFPYELINHIYKFFLIIPIPIISFVLGFIYRKKGYNCGKNIIPFVVIIALFIIGGHLINFYETRISKNINYLDKITEQTNISFPQVEDIRIIYNYTDDSESIAMVKFTDNKVFENTIIGNSNWKKDTDFFPEYLNESYSTYITTNCEYHTVYNINTNSYNNFEGQIIYMAYDIDLGVLVIYCYI